MPCSCSSSPSFFSLDESGEGEEKVGSTSPISLEKWKGKEKKESLSVIPISLSSARGNGNRRDFLLPQGIGEKEGGSK